MIISELLEELRDGSATHGSASLMAADFQLQLAAELQERALTNLERVLLVGDKLRSEASGVLSENTITVLTYTLSMLRAARRLVRRLEPEDSDYLHLIWDVTDAQALGTPDLTIEEFEDALAELVSVAQDTGSARLQEFMSLFLRYTQALHDLPAPASSVTWLISALRPAALNLMLRAPGVEAERIITVRKAFNAATVASEHLRRLAQ